MKDCWEDVETDLLWQPFSTKFLNAYVKRKWDYDFPWKLFGSLSDMDICYLKFCGTICVNVINTPPLYVLTFLYSSGVVSSCRWFVTRTLGKKMGCFFLITDALLCWVISTDLPYAMEILNSVYAQWSITPLSD